MVMIDREPCSTRHSRKTVRQESLRRYNKRVVPRERRERVVTGRDCESRAIKQEIRPTLIHVRHRIWTRTTTCQLRFNRPRSKKSSSSTGKSRRRREDRKRGNRNACKHSVSWATTLERGSFKINRLGRSRDHHKPNS